MSFHIIVLEDVIGGDFTDSCDSLKASFLLSQDKVNEFYFNGLNLLKSHIFLVANFNLLFFLTELHIFQIFSLCFLLPILTPNLAKTNQQ
jgi:hypothetical protein